MLLIFCKYHGGWCFNDAVAGPSREVFAHLFRRAAFGASPAELDAAMAKGWDATVEELLAGLHAPGYGVALPPPKLTTLGEHNQHADLWKEFGQLTNWWLELMATTTTPLREKLVLLLHQQFPTAMSKVGWPSMMLAQNQIFRTLGPGSFDTLLQAVAKDP